MTTVFNVHVLAADYGDCLWIEYGDSRAVHRLLIDAGTPGTFRRLSAELERVHGREPSHELLVVTHVDEDHIGGALKLLANSRSAEQFRHVWFNGRKHLAMAGDEEDFGPIQGERFTTALKHSGIPWNAHFKGGPVARARDGRPITVPLPAGAQVTVLTPSFSKLEQLLPVWDATVTEANLNPMVRPAPPPTQDDEEAFGAIDVEALASQTTGVDAAAANGSSIGMLLEYDKKKVLLAADAHPDDLLAGIHALTGGDTLAVDVFKLPHHGSKHNVTDQLLAAVDAKRLNRRHCRRHDVRREASDTAEQQRGLSRLGDCISGIRRCIGSGDQVPTFFCRFTSSIHSPERTFRSIRRRTLSTR